MADFGRTQGSAPAELSTREDLEREKLKLESLLSKAAKYSELVSDRNWAHYQEYLKTEILIPAEGKVRTLSPFTNPVELHRNQVIVEIITQILMEPRRRGSEAAQRKLMDKLSTLKLRITNAFRRKQEV